MKCQNLFSRKNKKNIINVLSAELAQRVVKVNAPKKHTFCVFIALEKRGDQVNIFFKSATKTYVMGTH